MRDTELPPRSERLLVVEDDPFSLQLIEMYLHKAGFTEITVATDGRLGLELARTNPFDLVLLDLNLPKLNGIEVLRRLKREGILTSTPVMVLSSLTDFDETVRCVELGAEDYLAKPFNALLLQTRIDACLEKRRLTNRISADQEQEVRQLDAARSLQASLLRIGLAPPGPDFPVELSTLFEPAPAVGGALIDAFTINDGTLCIVVGTVSGIGISAVLEMARTRSLVRGFLEAARDDDGGPMQADKILTAVNQELCRDNALGQSVTLFLGLLTPATGALAFACVGQPDPCVLSASGLLPLTGERGRMLGLEPDQTYRIESRQLEPGEALVVFTDSILTMTNAEAVPYGGQRLMGTLQSLLGASPATIVETLKDEVRRHIADGRLTDDIVVLALRLQAAA